MKQLRIGVIGYKFMGKAHSNAYRSLPMFFQQAVKPQMSVICGRNEEAVQGAAAQIGWSPPFNKYFLAKVCRKVWQEH
jgi:predicted dehydrogenase